MGPKRVVTGISDDSDDDYLTMAPAARADAKRPPAAPPTATTAPSAASAASEALLAQRRAMRAAPKPAAKVAPAAALGGAVTESRTGVFRAVAPVAASVPDASLPATTSPRASSPAAGAVPSPAPMTSATPAVVASPAVAVAPPALPQGPTLAELEELARLRAAVESRRAAFTAAQRREHELREQMQLEDRTHAARVQQLEEEAARLTREAEAERGRQADELESLRRQHEAELRAEREAIEKAAAAEADPALRAAQARVEALREEKRRLQQSIDAAQQNVSETDRILSAAVTRVVGSVRAAFEKQFEEDAAWEGGVRALIREEVQASFVDKAREEEHNERAEHARAFREMLEFWAAVEDEERRNALQQDDQVMLDLQAMAHEDLDRLQHEELVLQRAFAEQREKWMRAHRDALSAEVEAALHRRSVEFEEVRSLRRAAFAAQLQDLEAQHASDMQRDRELHDARLAALKDQMNMRDQMREERAEMTRSLGIEAEDAATVLRESVEAVGLALGRLGEYKKALDAARDEARLEGERAQRERATHLEDLHKVLEQQLSGVESEQRLLTAGSAKLESALAMLQRQTTEERQWAAEALTKLDRSRIEWDREYRRWQATSAQEKRAAQDRFASLMTELQTLTEALAAESRAVESEVVELRRREDERARSVAESLAALAHREEEVGRKHAAVLASVGDLEQRSRELAGEWQQLQAQRTELQAQRRELEQEDGRLAAAHEQLYVMRGQALQARMDGASAVERARNIDAHVAASRQVLGAEAAAAQRQQHAAAARAGSAQERAAAGSKAAALRVAMGREVAMRRHAAAGIPTGVDRLPMRVMSDLQAMLHEGAAPHSSTAVHADPAVSEQATLAVLPHDVSRHPQAHGSVSVSALTHRPPLGFESQNATQAGIQNATFVPLLNISDATNAF